MTGNENESAGLEQRCIQPGLWMIEGHAVSKVLGGWRVYRSIGSSDMSAPHLFQARYLDDVRAWIWRQS